MFSWVMRPRPRQLEERQDKLQRQRLRVEQALLPLQLLFHYLREEEEVGVEVHPHQRQVELR